MVMHMSRCLSRSLFGRLKGKLVFQIGVLILFSSFLSLSFSFAFQYHEVAKILQRNYEESCVKRFQKVEADINNLHKQMDILSSRLVTLELLQSYNSGSTDSLAQLVTNVGLLNQRLIQDLNDYAFLDCIAFYGSMGNAVRQLRYQRPETNMFFAAPREVLYYDSAVFRELESSKPKLRWFGGYSLNALWEGEAEDSIPRPVILVARRIVNDVGHLVISINSEHINHLICSTNTNEHEIIYITDENNCIVTAQDANLLGQQKIFDSLETISGGVQRCFIEDERLEKMQVLVCPLPALGWQLVFEIPYAEMIKDTESLLHLLLISYGICITLFVCFTMIWISIQFKPLKKLAQAAQIVGEGKLGYHMADLPNNEIGVVIREFNRMSTDLEDLFTKNKQIERNRRRFEMQALRYQINPHMIHNTLTTIRWMAVINEEKNIADSITLLSDFLMPIFKDQGPVCTLCEELDYVKKYVKIMNLRVLKEYQLMMDVPLDYYCDKVPRFLLQPIVENAILHGYKGKGDGRIRISMWKDGEDCYISIKDWGSGMSPNVIGSVLSASAAEASAAPEARHVGVVNVDRRIKNLYGDDCGLDIHSVLGSGTEVILHIKQGVENIESL